MSQPLVDIDRFEAQFDGLLEGLQETLFHKIKMSVITVLHGNWWFNGIKKSVRWAQRDYAHVQIIQLTEGCKDCFSCIR